MLRFNEAIDQAIAESTARFTEQTEHTRETFLAILGHDLRTPLAAMTMGGDMLMMANISRRQTAEVGSRVKRGAVSMSAMVKDMLEYARTQLGAGMPISRKPTDIREICRSAVEDVRAAHTDCGIELEMTGDLSGAFDAARLEQVVSNLLINAVQYRSKVHPVGISASEEAHAVAIHVQNQGPVIPKVSLQAIFNPLVQLAGDRQQEGRPATSLGLGLFIAREVTQAHEGTITAQSNESTGIIFTIRLPKVRPIV